MNENCKGIKKSNNYDEVVIVNEQDEKIGVAEKIQAHVDGLLHRAFSVFLFRFNENTNNIEIMLQQRQKDKYHSGELWSNTCCSHPRDNETLVAAGLRRLKEELGIKINDLESVGHFIYKIKFENNISEHELDHVLVGCLDRLERGEIDKKDYIKPNAEEIMDWKWISVKDFENEIQNNSDKYSYWLSKAYSLVKRKFKIVEAKLGFFVEV